jgi:hypothetical protein
MPKADTVAAAIIAAAINILSFISMILRWLMLLNIVPVLYKRRFYLTTE